MSYLLRAMNSRNTRILLCVVPSVLLADAIPVLIEERDGGAAIAASTAAGNARLSARFAALVRSDRDDMRTWSD